MLGMRLVVELDDKGSIKKVETLRHGFEGLKRNVQGGAATIAAGTDKIGRGFSGLTRILSRAAMVAKLAMAAMAVATIVTGAKFEQAMANVASVAGATEAELKQLSDTARRWGSQTAFSATEAAEGMYSLASAGMKVGEMRQAIGGVLMFAGAAATSLAEASEATVQALRMFGLQASETNRVVNVFAAGISASMLTADRLKESLSMVGSTAHALGMTLEQTVGTLGMLHNAGMVGSMAGTRLQNVLVQLGKASPRVRGLLGELAFTGDNLAEIMQHLADRGTTVGEVFEAFGQRGAPAVLAMMAAGQAEMQRMSGAVTGTQKAWEMYEMQMATVQSQFKIFKSAMQENMIAAFMALRPAITQSLQYLIDLAQRARPYVIGLAKTVGDFVTANTELIKGMASTGVKVLGGVVAFMALAKAIAIVKGITLATWGVLQVGVGVFQLLWAALAAFKTASVAAWAVIHAVALGPWGWLVIVAGAALVAVIALMIKYRDTIKALVKSVADRFGESWKWIAERSEGMWTALKAHAQGNVIPIMGAIAGIPIAASYAFEYAEEKGTDFLEGLRNKVDEVVGRVRGLIASFGEIGAGEIGMDIVAGGMTGDEKERMAALTEYTDWAQGQVDMLADYERAQLHRTVAWARQHTTGWLEAKKALIEGEIDWRMQKENITQEELALLEIERSERLMEARMMHEDAVIAHWQENNAIVMAGLGALGAAYDTFFDTILDKEMTGKQRREEMWRSAQQSFIRTTANMLRQWVAMELRNMLIVSSMKDKLRMRERFAEAKLGAIRAYRAFASIPIIGPALGAAAAAAAFAFLMAFHQGGQIPGRRNDIPILAQGGEYMVRRESVTPQTMPALQHINMTGQLPAPQVAAPSVNLQFNVTGSQATRETIQQFIEDEVVPRIEDFFNRGGYRPGVEVVLT